MKIKLSFIIITLLAISSCQKSSPTTEIIAEKWIGSYELALNVEARLGNMDSTVSSKAEPCIISISKQDDYTVSIYNYSNKKAEWKVTGVQRGGVLYLTGMKEGKSVLGNGKLEGILIKHDNGLKVSIKEEFNSKMTAIGAKNLRETSVKMDTDEDSPFQFHSEWTSRTHDGTVDIEIPIKATFKKEGTGVQIAK